MLGCPSSEILSNADLIIDINSLKSGFSREVTGNLGFWLRGGGRGISSAYTNAGTTTSDSNNSSCTSCKLSGKDTYRNECKQVQLLKVGNFLNVNYHITDSGGDVKAVKLVN